MLPARGMSEDLEEGQMPKLARFASEEDSLQMPNFAGNSEDYQMPNLNNNVEEMQMPNLAG